MDADSMETQQNSTLERVYDSYIEKSLNSIISPTETLFNVGSICASALQIDNHFALKSVELEDELRDTFRKWFKWKREDIEPFMGNIYSCMGAICHKSTMLHGSQHVNEVKIRFALCDPILELLCKTWKFKVSGSVCSLITFYCGITYICAQS